MRTYMVEHREGEDMGPIDWSHPIAKDKPPEWREAEQFPDHFTWGDYGKSIIALRMYDGWPYWTPRPAAMIRGPLGVEWAFFDSYGAGIFRKKQP